MTEQDRAAWLEQRRKCITGTDIAAIVGLSRYSSPMSVFMDKVGLSEPFADNEPMRWGRTLEPVIAERYATDNGVELRKGEFISCGIFGGTPDYLAPERLVEIKTAGYFAGRHWGEPGTDQVPEAYLCQVQWYLNLVDQEMADIAVLIGGQDYRTYTVVRNKTLIELLTASAETFWENHVVLQVPPAIDATDGSEAYLKAFFPRSRGNMLDATENTIALIHNLRRVKETAAKIDAEKRFLENQIKELIGDNDGIVGSDFKATWRSTKDAEKVAWETVAKRLNASPELIKECTVIQPGSRRFLLTFNGE